MKVIFKDDESADLYAFRTAKMSEPATRGVLQKEMFLKISQKLQEKTCVGVFFFNKHTTILKIRLRHRCFLVNFAKFIRKPFSQNIVEWLLLNCLQETFMAYFKGLQCFFVKFPIFSSDINCIWAAFEGTDSVKRSSLPEVFYEKAIFLNFEKFLGKYLCWISFFNACYNFIKKKLQHSGCELYDKDEPVFWYKYYKAVG